MEYEQFTCEITEKAQQIKINLEEKQVKQLWEYMRAITRME